MDDREKMEHISSNDCNSQNLQKSQSPASGRRSRSNTDLDENEFPTFATAVQNDCVASVAKQTPESIDLTLTVQERAVRSSFVQLEKQEQLEQRERSVENGMPDQAIIASKQAGKGRTKPIAIRSWGKKGIKTANHGARVTKDDCFHSPVTTVPVKEIVLLQQGRSMTIDEGLCTERESEADKPTDVHLLMNNRMKRSKLSNCKDQSSEADVEMSSQCYGKPLDELEMDRNIYRDEHSRYCLRATSSSDTSSENEIGLGEKQAECSKSPSTFARTVIHERFCKPVAIRSKNCYEVVKKKSTCITTEENEATSLRKIDETQSVLKSTPSLTVVPENKSSSKKLDKKSRWRSAVSHLKRMKMNISSQKWQVNGRPSVDKGLQKLNDDDEDSADRRAVLEARRIFEQFLKEISLEGSKAAKRADLEAGQRMKIRDLRVNTRRCIGCVPGIKVGDRFMYRMEMLVVGLHMQVQAGIDFIGAEESHYNEAVATSIVASVGLDYDLNGGDTLVYTGQGGKVDKDGRIQKDQKMERGNLALKNSHIRGLPVRVIRCYEGKNPKTQSRIYTYDGLYLVQNVWSVKGNSGYLVYKFCLQRIPGQRQLDSVLTVLPSSWRE